MAVTDPNQYIPQQLLTPNFLLRPITADDAELDYQAVMDTRSELRLWSQSSWPADDFTVDDNRRDLVSMAERRQARRAFDYTVLDPTGSRCLGCVYIFPPGARFLTKATITPLTDRNWSELQAVVYFWVRSPLSQQGRDADLLSHLRHWLTEVWGLQRVGYVASEVHTRQLAVMKDAGLVPTFKVKEPDKSGNDVVFCTP